MKNKVRVKRDFSPILNAVLTILMGVLFIILKERVIKYALTVFGAVLVVLAVVDLIDHIIPAAIIKAVIGVLAIVFGWTLFSAALYILAALLIIYGLVQIYELARAKVRASKGAYTLLIYAVPAVSIAAGLCLFINQGGTVTWVFILTGVLLIIEGVLSLANAVSRS